MGVYAISRDRMVQKQLATRGITDPVVLAAMRKTPRHLFMEPAMASQAYGDYPVPIGHGQTMSQPYVVAVMSQLLEAGAGMRILEIGTGSGYQAAVLHDMGLDVYSVERLRELYVKTRDLLRQLKYTDIKVRLADGTLGWPEAAPFDRIIITAGGPVLPEPLLEQLADPGLLLMPLGPSKAMQKLTIVRKRDGRITREEKESVVFVDLIGAHGW